MILGIQIIALMKIMVMLGLPIISWYLWSIHQKFISKTEINKILEINNQKYKDIQNQIAINKESISECKRDIIYYKDCLDAIKKLTTEQELRLNKQNINLIEIKTDIKHIAKAIEEIKDCLFIRK